MVKDLKKVQVFQPHIINNVLGENITPTKPRQQINQENYQKNKEKLKVRQKEKYKQQKEQVQKLLAKHYQANSIKVLLPLKEYTELNPQKRKLWLEFAWTLQDCQDQEGIKIYDIIQIQKLEQLAGNLIRDYYQTTQKKIKSSWNTLTTEKQAQLIKYWGREKVRKEQELTEALAEQENQGKNYEKELELAKFHEERGKIKCECYSCAEKKEIHKEIKEKLFNENSSEKKQCPECQKWVKNLDEEAEVCKNCKRKYE